MEKKNKPQLKEEVAKDYELAKIAYAGVINHPKYGLVDLSTISTERAKQLADADDFIYLVKKSKSTSSK